jgi:putative ABC transport system permease protein
VIEALRQDLTQAIRALRRAPGFAAVAILTLALGIGATTAVFSIISTALLDPLPYPNAARLVSLTETRGRDEISVSYPDFLDWREQGRAFGGLSAFYGFGFNLVGSGAPERIAGAAVSANMWSTLGVRPLLGRAFGAEEDEPGSQRVTAIGYGLWQTRFGGDPAIVGTSITLNAEPYTIVAVMPPGFRFPDGIVYGAADLWVPISELSAREQQIRDSHPGLYVMGVLGDGISVQAARSDLEGLAARLGEAYPASNRQIGVTLVPAADRIVGELRSALWILFGAVALVLLIACSNVAALLLTRAAARKRELSVRMALGAGRWQVAGHLLAEGGVLAVLGGLAGVATALVLVRVGTPLVAGLPRLQVVHLDWRALLVAAGATLATALAFGLAPLLWLARADLEPSLKSRGAGTDARSARLRRLLVGGQVALAAVLLVGAGLLLQTFARLAAERGGIDPVGVLTFSIRLPETSYDGARSNQFYRALADRIGSLPGVMAVGAVSVLPFSGAGAQSGIRPGEAPAVPESERRTDVQVATPGYFAAMGIELVRGRLFGEEDRSDGPEVAVVDEELARAFWGDEDPIGRRVVGWGGERTVVGVVRHVKTYGIAAASRQELYVPHAQRPFQRMHVVARISGEPLLLVSAIRREIAGLDPNLPISGVRSMQDVVDATAAGPRLAAVLSGSFAALAVLLALLGIYGVTAYVVTQRSREIGVRIALGATPRAVMRLVVGQGLRLAGASLVVGLLAALAASRVLRSHVYGVSPTDVPTYALVPIGLLVVAALGSSLPALRAARISPAEVLTDE